MVAHTIVFLAVRNVLRLAGLGPRPDAKDGSTLQLTVTSPTGSSPA